MTAKKILQQKGIDSNKAVFLINREEALGSLMAAIEEYCPSVKVEKIVKNDLIILIDSLGENIVNYHPEDYHQERSTLLGCSDMLRKYGLTDKELENLDFC